MKKQARHMTKQWLLQQGYYVVDAAAALGVSHGHVSRVLAGKRVSAGLVERMHALPKRELRAITHKRKGGAR